MTVVSMQGFRPPPRYDGQTWRQMRIEEASSSAGPWTQIDMKDLAVMPYRLDPDPLNPQARDWTTELATLDAGAGWYRVRFRDQTGDLSEYSDPVWNSTVDWLPTLRQVAVHIKARTVERDTNQFAGVFTDKTRPTDDEAWEAVQLAESDVISAIGAPDAAAISSNGHRAIQSVIALRAAMLIERSYYGEQVGTAKSAYPALERDWERVLPQLIDAIEEDLAGDIIPDTGGGVTTGGDGGPVVETDRDLVVPSGSRIHTKTGVWLGDSTVAYSFPTDAGGVVNYDTEF